MSTAEEISANTSFPLPFRVVLLAGLGILGWAANLHGLYAFNIDAVSALDLRVESFLPKSPYPLPAHRWTLHGRRLWMPPYTNIYYLCASYFLWFFLTWSLYSLGTRSSPLFADAFKYIAAVSLITIIGVTICPFDTLFKRERDQFLRVLKRCLFPSSSNSIYFSDIIFADILTSFAKILGDFCLSCYMLLPGNSILGQPHVSGWKRWLLPTIMSLPYLVRLRQCLIEYRLPSNESRRPLFNALKYATSFPVIYFSAAHRAVLLELAKVKGDEVFRNPWHGEHLLFRLWFLTAIINSFYSFWWDVTHDWGLHLLKPQDRDSCKPPPRSEVPSPRDSSGFPLLSRHNSEDTVEGGENDDLRSQEYHKPRYHSLRPTLLYPAYVYPLLVAINFVLRMTWSIKLSSHLHLQTDGGHAIFYVEIAEIVRRWLWVFIRVEWEMIKRNQEASKAKDEYQLDVPSPSFR